MYYRSFHNADLSELKCKNLKFVAPKIILGTVKCCKQMFGARCLIWCITTAKVYYIRVQEPGRNGNGKDRRSSFKISKLKSHEQQVRNYHLLAECEIVELDILVNGHCQSNCTDLSVTCRSTYNLGPTSYVACIATWRWYYLQIHVLI
jgi:hypothetical protein